jgi:hypothetical protein
MPPVLSEFAPRLAGAEAVEPTVGFGSNTNPIQEMARCAGCCKQATAVEWHTHSVTQ